MRPPEREAERHDTAGASHRVIPLRAAEAADAPGCAGSEPFALMVLGEAMLPEFAEGDVVVVEPDGLAGDGSFVVAQVDGDWMLRRLVRDDGGWHLCALDPAYLAIPIADLSPVRGVVIQKARPGRRRATRRYVD